MLPQIFLLLIIATLTVEERIITTVKYSTFRVAPTVVNGNPVSEGQVPFLVSIKEPIQNVSKTKKLWANLCGGSIISNLKVLTAAHCFEGKNYYFAKNYHLLRIVAGSLQNELIHTGKTKTSDSAQWRSISKLNIHKDFQFPNNDIALVTVDEKFKFSKTVDFVIPGTTKTDYPTTCIAAGFGQTSQSPKSPVSKKLMWADIYVLSRHQCNVWWEMNMDTFICTNSQATDVGGGDSGGPLTCFGTLDPMEKKGKDLLVGIVSGKNYDKTTLFTRVSAYKDWLREPAAGCDKFEAQNLVVCSCLFITLFYIRLLILFISRPLRVWVVQFPKFPTN